MSIQYKDNSFSEIMPFNEIYKKFLEAVELNEAKALFVGTKKEVKQQIEDANLSKKLESLSNRLNTIETQLNSPIKTLNDFELKKVVKLIQNAELLK